MQLHKTKAFTLVELIVVITILAILGTIAFMSLQGYSRDARDTARISDLSRIKTSLELYYVEAGKYPDPTEAQPVTFSGGLAWYQGTFGNSTFVNVSKLDSIPKDPITDKEYSYSLLNTKQEYELSGIMEGDEIASSDYIIPETNAGEKTAKAKISGTYNGLSLRINTNGTSYVLAIPSITTSIDLSVENNRNLETIIPAKELVLNNYRNLPSNYNNSSYNPNIETTNTEFEITSLPGTITSAILFEGNIKDLTATQLLTKLQEAYSGTTVAKIRQGNELLSVNLNDSNQLENIDKFGVTFINKYLGGSAESRIYNTCNGIAHNTTKSFYSGTGVTLSVGTCDGLKQDFVCKDGIWKNGETVLDTNTYPYETCTVEPGQNCTHLGTELNHGDSLDVYSQSSIAWDATENCNDTGIYGQVTCNDGTMTGDTGYGYKVCAKGTPDNCTANVSFDDGGSLLQSYNVPQLNHGQSYTGYLDIPENNGTFRYSLDVVCNNGTLSPTETGPELQSCNTGYFWNSTSCESQWSGNTTSGYLYKNTSGVEQYPLNCNDLLDQSTWKNTLSGSPWNGSVFTSGIYWIKPNSNAAFKVYCDMTNSGGGWTMLSNVVSYDGTNVYISGNACTSTTTNCGGDLIKLGNSTIDYTKVKILHQNGKYVIFNLKNGGNFENMFSGLATYSQSLDGVYIYEDNIHNRAGYSDLLWHRGANTSGNSLWLANSSSNNTGRHTYAYKWSGNCATIGYSNGTSSCVATGGFSIFVKKETETSLGSVSTFPGKSCKAIKDAGYSTGDGAYWIKPDVNAAFQVYCDMTTYGGGWTLVRKMKSDTLVTGATTATNASSLTTLTTASANLADTTWNAINPTQVWNICNGYQTIYNRNMAVAWYSNHGVIDSCGYNRNFWTSMQKNFGTAAITTFTYQACGGGYSTTYTAWGILSGIHGGNSYNGCYDAQYGANTTSAAPVKYDNRSGSAIGWAGNGYVLIR